MTWITDDTCGAPHSPDRCHARVQPWRSGDPTARDSGPRVVMRGASTSCSTVALRDERKFDEERDARSTCGVSHEMCRVP